MADGDESDASKKARELIIDPVSEAASTMVNYTGKKVKGALSEWLMGPWWLWLGIGMWIGLRRRRK